MSKKKILIVEDDERVALALQVRLKAEGYQVVTAPDSIYGVSKARQESPDLVLLDVMMPGAGGVWVAERLQEIEETRDLPVVFLTASRRRDLRSRARDLGAKAYFEKPYDSRQLVATIGELVGS